MKPFEAPPRAVRSSRWASRIARMLAIPSEPPLPPGDHSEVVHVLRPEAGFLKYVSVRNALGYAGVLTVGFLIAWLEIVDEEGEGSASPSSEWIIGALAVYGVLLVVGLCCVLTAARVRAEVTWYILTERSVRIRTGAWKIRESTISLRNVQDVRVTQGPIQRCFGFSTLTIATAGAAGACTGSAGPLLSVLLEFVAVAIPPLRAFSGLTGAIASGSHKDGRKRGRSCHHAAMTIEGIRDARALRDQLLALSREGSGFLRRSVVGRGVTREHIDVLRRIRDEAAAARAYNRAGSSLTP